MKKPMTLHEDEPRVIQRADRPPESGYSIVVDGCFKTNYVDEETAKNVGLDLLSRYPMLQVMIYDAATKVRTPIS